MTTITVAGFQIAEKELNKVYWLGFVYIICSFLSFVFSLVSLITASRVLLSVNKVHPRNVLDCIESLNAWGAVDAYWWFSRSLQFLVLSALLSIYMLFDVNCFVICCILTLIPFLMMWHLHKAHTDVVWDLLNLDSGRNET